VLCGPSALGAYAPFDLSALSDDECVQYFRFRRGEIRQLAAALHLPVVVTVARSRVAAPREEALCIVLAFPGRHADLAPMLRRSASALSEIGSFTTDWLAGSGAGCSNLIPLACRATLRASPGRCSSSQTARRDWIHRRDGTRHGPSGGGTSGLSSAGTIAGVNVPGRRQPRRACCALPWVQLRAPAGGRPPPAQLQRQARATTCTCCARSTPPRRHLGSQPAWSMADTGYPRRRHPPPPARVRGTPSSSPAPPRRRRRRAGRRACGARSRRSAGAGGGCRRDPPEAPRRAGLTPFPLRLAVLLLLLLAPAAGASRAAPSKQASGAPSSPSSPPCACCSPARAAAGRGEEARPRARTASPRSAFAGACRGRGRPGGEGGAPAAPRGTTASAAPVGPTSPRDARPASSRAASPAAAERQRQRRGARERRPASGCTATGALALPLLLRRADAAPRQHGRVADERTVGVAG
jgi:hypothetical protein